MTKPKAGIHRTASKLAALVLLLSTIFVLSALDVLPFPAITIQWPSVHTEDSAQYVPSFERPLERELVLVYFGSASCVWCSNPDLPGIIDSVKSAVRAHAAAHGMSFTALGVALDWDAKEGMAHLDKIGRFDDIATGRSIYGLGARTYKHLLDGTPQVSVLKRTPSTLSDGAPTHFEEKELIRQTSVYGIATWVRRGAPIPADTY